MNEFEKEVQSKRHDLFDAAAGFIFFISIFHDYFLYCGYI